MNIISNNYRNSLNKDFILEINSLKTPQECKINIDAITLMMNQDYNTFQNHNHDFKQTLYSITRKNVLKELISRATNQCVNIYTYQIKNNMNIWDLNLDIFESITKLFGEDYKEFIKYMHEQLNEIIMRKTKEDPETPENKEKKVNKEKKLSKRFNSSKGRIFKKRK